jgi:chromosome segregation ATPase
MSTLTQSTLNEAIKKIRNETAQSIEKLRADMQKDIQSMEGNIAAAVINALKATPTTVQMDTDTEVESTQSTQDTTTTMKTIADKFEALTNIVQTLSQQVLSLTTNQEKLQKELAEKGEANLNKRNRPPDLPARKLAPSLNSAHQQAQSPPTKQPRASTPTPPATPPPKGIPATAGTREGS